MAFDVDAFRKAAEAAGISKAEIENEIKFQTSAPAKTDPFEKDEGGFKLGSLEQIQERLGNDWWHLPAGLAVLGAAAYGAEKLMGGSSKQTPPPGPRIEPTMGAETIPMQPVKPELPQQTNLTPEDIQARAASLRPVAPTAPAVPSATTIPVAPEVPVSTPITAAPVDAPAPVPSAAPNSPVTSIVTDTVKEMIQETPAQPEVAKPAAPTPAPVAPPQDLRTGTGKPAFAGMGPEAALNKKGEPKFKPEYASIEAVPRGYAFVPNAQYIDTLRQNIGQPDYTRIFTERDFPLSNEMAIEQSKEINRSLGRATRAEAKAAGLPPAEITPGITKKTSAGTKPVRVAGTVGALMAVSDLAKAETPGQRGMAGANLLEAVLPPGFMMSGAGEGSGTVPSMSQYMLLGSPYAQTPLAVKQRQALEYERKVGAGRGIAPPSAYQR